MICSNLQQKFDIQAIHDVSKKINTLIWAVQPTSRMQWSLRNVFNQRIDNNVVDAIDFQEWDSRIFCSLKKKQRI
jgi:hypothetical protein